MKYYQKALSNGESFSIPHDGVGKDFETISASATLTADQSGKVLLVGTDALTLTLPATEAGLVYNIVNSGADAAVGITISPNSSDALMGSFNNGGAKTVMTGTDDKDIVNTKATARKGDWLQIVADGSAGWYISGGVGVWTEEDQTADDTVVNAETVETLTSNKTLDAADSGKVFLIGTDALTMTLPATAEGLRYEFINIGADGNNIITISPNASDKIQGSFSNDGINIVLSGTDDKDLVNTKATAKTGDRLVLIGDGSAGWYIEDAVGIWTEEDKSPNFTTLSDNTTLSVEDSGKTYYVDTDAKTITLPATALGIRYKIVNIGADGAVGITISPNASDAILGTINNNGVLTQMSETDNKDIVNTKATANNGDSIELVGDGSVGWYIIASTGIWTEESQTVLNANPVTVQSVTGALTLVAADSGKTLLLNAAAGAQIDLPAPASGLNFEVITILAFATTPWTIVTNGGDNIIQGGAIVNSTFVPAADEDQIEFDESTESVGDYVRLISDGTNWYCSGVGATAGSIVFTAT